MGRRVTAQIRQGKITAQGLVKFECRTEGQDSLNFQVNQFAWQAIFGDAETKLRVDDAVWHRTGDAGSYDARGRLWLLGRCAARIADRHGTLYALAVECALSRHPGIRRSAVVAHRGRRILAVEPDDAAIPLDPADLPALVPWARLDAVETCRRLPVDRRHNAKIDYPALRRLLDAR